MRAYAARATEEPSRSKVSKPRANGPSSAACRSLVAVEQKLSSADVRVFQPHQVLYLQRAIGNHRVGELLRRAYGMASPVGSSVRPEGETHFGHDFSKVPVHPEQPAVNRSVTEFRATSERGGGLPNSSRSQELAPPIVHAVLRSCGEPLEMGARALFESRFARDFGYVRVHRDTEAARSAEAVGAAAYTVGHHIVFGSGRYDIASAQGQTLLGHELTHTVQQEGQQPSPDGVEIAEADSPLEREGAEVAEGGNSSRYTPATRTPRVQLLRQRAASPTATPAKEPEVAEGPTLVGRSHDELTRRRRIADAAEARYSIKAPEYIDSAFQWALAGERVAVAQVDDPVVKENFYRALAGNMLWAATSIFAIWNPAVIPMSFIGAALGSGIAAEESGLPRGEELLTQRWAREADKVDGESGSLRVQAAELAAAADIPEWDYDALDQTLWQVMFPKIPWATKRETIVELARTRVQHALTDFLRQYQAWRREIAQCIALRMPTSEEPTLPSWVSIGAPEECARIYPFNPTVDFGLELSEPPGSGKR